MSLSVTCTCGKTFDLKDELAGQVLACPNCGAAVQVPPLAAAPARQVDPAFDRDRFLINQKIRIDEKYAVTDEQGRQLMFVVRPRYFLRGIASLLAGLLAGFAFLSACIALAGDGKGVLAGLVLFIGFIGLFVVTIVVAMLIQKKRHVTFYRDERMAEPLLEVLQDRKFQPITATYTLREPNGEVLARLRKNYLYNFFRKRWVVVGPNGDVTCRAMEDSIILSMLRRLLGPLFGLLRTNYLILRGTGDEVIGEFNRKVTILDRYVLDMTDDPSRTLDRRIALGLGVMLDSGERR